MFRFARSHVGQAKSAIKNWKQLEELKSWVDQEVGRAVSRNRDGAVVLIVAGVFLYFFIATAQIQTVQGYTVSARFGHWRSSGRQ